MSLDPFYASLFSCESNNPQIQLTKSGKPFTISINIITKWLSAFGSNKSVVPGDIPGESLMLGGEALIPYLARYLDIRMNNNIIQVTGEKLEWFPFTKSEIDR
jgi:hypothetical protein